MWECGIYRSELSGDHAEVGQRVLCCGGIIPSTRMINDAKDHIESGIHGGVRVTVDEEFK